MFCRDLGRVRGGDGGSPGNEQIPPGGGALAQEKGGGQAEAARIRSRLSRGFVRRGALARRFLADRLHASLREDRSVVGCLVSFSHAVGFVERFCKNNKCTIARDDRWLVDDWE